METHPEIATGEDRRVDRLVIATGLGIVFFGLVQFLPAALTQTGFPPTRVYTGFAVSMAVSMAGIVIVGGRERPLYTHGRGAVVIGLYFFLAWVVLQTALREGSDELPRALAFGVLMVSGHVVGRYLADEGRYRDFLAGLAPYFVGTYAAGFVVALVNPDGIWWGHGILGSNRLRSWFFWILVPQPVFAVAALLYRRARNRPARIYELTMIVTLVLVVMTRTRTYVLTIGALLLLLYTTRYTGRYLMVGLAATAAVLGIPGALAQVATLTRISTFYQGVDPVSGSTDVSNGREELYGVLQHFIGLHPFSGAGASTVRDAIGPLGASSEAGVLITFASYGIVPGLLLVIYILTAAIRALVIIGARAGDRGLACLAVVVAAFSAVLFFGSSTSFSDWLAMVVISVVLHLPSGVASEPVDPSVTEAPMPLPGPRGGR